MLSTAGAALTMLHTALQPDSLESIAVLLVCSVFCTPSRGWRVACTRGSSSVLCISSESATALQVGSWGTRRGAVNVLLHQLTAQRRPMTCCPWAAAPSRCFPRADVRAM